MNNRQRIIQTVLCQDVDRLPFTFYFGPWGETIERWRQEGLGQQNNWDEGFGFDEGFVHVNVNLGYAPAFEAQVLEEKSDTRIIKDAFGITQEIRKSGASIPRYIEYPVKNFADWYKLKEERLNPDDPHRFPENWNELVKQYNEGDKIVQLGWYPYGLFGTLRDMMGVETLLIAFYDQPELIHEMMDYLTDFWLSLYAKVCQQVKVDAIHMWEDMSGKNGSLISPKMVRTFMMPNYKKIKAFADAQGIPIFSLDTDGDCSKLVPLYMECGINLIFPFEVMAGCDIMTYRKQYPNLAIMGGINKLEVAKGKESIDKELERIAEMFHHSGYIAALDHLPHPQISWEDFNYFVSRLKQIISSSALLTKE
jgi:hypothetical protein